MVIDLKTHIASLIAVFLAIGMGILIGVLVMGGNNLSKSQRYLIQSLRGQFSQLRQREHALTAQVSDLQGKVNTADHFANGVLPSLLATRLSGTKIAVVSLGGPVPSQVPAAIALAGGSVASDTTIRFSEFTADQQAALQQILGSTAGSNPADLKQGLAQLLALALEQGDNGTLALLSKQHLLSTHGDYSKPVQGVVLVGSDKASDATAFTLPFVRAVQAQKTNLVGVETVGANFSSVPAFEEEGISTVDDVDQPAGQVALVYALSGTVGNWGVKADAHDGLLPPLSPPPTLVPTGTGA